MVETRKPVSSRVTQVPTNGRSIDIHPCVQSVLPGLCACAVSGRVISTPRSIRFRISSHRGEAATARALT